MSRMSPSFLRTAAIALVLALAPSSARGVDLYQWVDPDGVVSIGPNPPAGVSAVPYAPGKPAAPTSQPAPAAPAVPQSSPPPAARRVDSPVGPTETPCAVYTNAARKAASELADAEREIARLETRIEELQESDLAYARTECVDKGDAGPDPNCRASTFDRDKEIVRSEKALEVAHEKLADAEAHVRDAAIPPRCHAPASAD